MKQRLIYWSKLLVFGLAAMVVVVYIAYFVAAIWYWTEPVPSRSEIPPDLNLDYREVSFSSTDDVQLVGWYFPP